MEEYLADRRHHGPCPPEGGGAGRPFYVRRAKELGVAIAIDSDAHRSEQFENLAGGISVALRGWLEKGDV